MSVKKRGNVWLGAAGLVIKDGKWLVVKKKYSGLKGQWSLPAGFVNKDETVDEAAVREVWEETGIIGSIEGFLGIRSGVIRGEISDNLVVFLMKAESGTLKPQLDELETACFLSPEELKHDERTSVILQYFLEQNERKRMSVVDTLNPGGQFEYTSYKLLI